MSGRKPPTVFVGNIPYDATEEQLKEKFSEAGPVVAFRLVYDRDTGKPKGFGFCEYLDEESAKCAMRNLHNTEFGGRHLRVDYQNEDRKDGPGPGPSGGPQATSTAGPLPSLSVPAAATVTPEMAINQIMDVSANLSEERIMELLMQFKSYMHAMPEQARYLLLQNPQLSFLLLQVSLRIGLVDKAQADAMVAVDADVELPSPMVVGTAPGPGASGMAPPLHMGMGPMGMQMPSQPGAMRPPGFPMGMMPPGFPMMVNPAMFGVRPPMPMPLGTPGPIPSPSPIPQHVNTQMPAHQSFPPMHTPANLIPPMGGHGAPTVAQQQPFQPPHATGTPTAIQQQAQQQLAGLTEDRRREYLELVLSLTPEDFAQLPPEQRESMLFLRREAEQLRQKG